jgi:hypothetical protein
MCRNCRRYVRQVKATAAALGMLPPPELSPDLEQELLRRFESWKLARPRRVAIGHIVAVRGGAR